MTLSPPGPPLSSIAIEPTFLEAIALVEAAADLSKGAKSQWTCSLRRAAHFLERPLHLVPARWSGVRQRLARLHHAPLGLTPKTLANHVANVKAALRWLREGGGAPSRGAPLAAEWIDVRTRCGDLHERAVLSGLMRFCSAQAIAPSRVDDAVLDRYFEHRAQTTALAVTPGARRRIARIWNKRVGSAPGFTAPLLLEPAAPALTAGPDWQDFAPGLRNDIEAYLAGLARVRKTHTGRRIAPCKPSTIKVRRAKLIAAVRKAATCGVPLKSLASLAALLSPSVSERILDAYWRRDGDVPKVYMIDLAQLFLAVAHSLAGFDKEDLERLKDMRSDLERHRAPGMTDKNLALIRRIGDEETRRRLLRIPSVLIERARTQLDHAPTKAAVMAQMAVAIRILLFAPIRLGNLARIRLGENLIRPGGPNAPYRLVFPGYDVKNRITLDFPLDPSLTQLIDEYLATHHAVLLRGRNEPWLFPGEESGHKSLTTLGDQISQTIEKTIGLTMTAHQFRHAAAAIVLRHQPGNYELVRQLLGHKTVNTTMRAYVGLETTHATEIFGGIIETELGRAKADEEDEF